MSHVVITCTCGPDRIAGRSVHSACPVPGHGDVPPDKVDPQTLADAGLEAVAHLNEAVLALMKARAAWVSRGLPADNAFPSSLDRLAGSITYQNDRMRKWAIAAQQVATERESRASASTDASTRDGDDSGSTQGGDR